MRDLTELHGGAVSGESAGEGRGATFTLELPLLDVPRRAHAPRRGLPALELLSPPRILKGKRVLLVEDDADTRTALAWLLEECRAKVTAVDSAARALQSFRGAVRRRPYDLLLSDIGMPGRDGYDLLKDILRHRAGGGRRVQAGPCDCADRVRPEQDRQKALACDFQLHLAKPFSPASPDSRHLGPDWLGGRGPEGAVRGEARACIDRPAHETGEQGRKGAMKRAHPRVPAA